MTVSSPFDFKSQRSKSSLFNPEANHQTMERKCWMDWGTPSPPGLTFSAHFLSFQDVHVCWTTFSFSMRWGTRLLGGQQQSEVNCKQSVCNLKERSSYPFTPIWKTVMGSLGSRVLSLTQSLYPVRCGMSQCQPGPMSTRTPRQCAAGSSWNFMAVAVVFRKGKQAVKKQRTSVTLLQTTLGFLGGSVVKNPSAMQETRVLSLSREDPLEKEIAARSSILAWEIPWTEEPGGLQSMGLQRVGHDFMTKQQQTTLSSLQEERGV